MFGKNGGLIGCDVIDTIASRHQNRSDVQLFLNDVCQTGSLWFVVSDRTVGDLDFHKCLLSKGNDKGCPHSAVSKHQESVVISSGL